MGFITNAKLGVNHAITDCDFKLYQHGEEHNPPTDYGFTFWAGNYKNYLLRDGRRLGKLKDTWYTFKELKGEKIIGQSFQSFSSLLVSVFNNNLQNFRISLSS